MQIGMVPLFAAMQYVFGILMFLTSVFLILLVLVQRGRGGGLAGAFGGMGGQSAFGTKAGDLFTRITMVAATFWILLCILSIVVLNRPTSPFGGGFPGQTGAPTGASGIVDEPPGTPAGGAGAVPGEPEEGGVEPGGPLSIP